MERNDKTMKNKILTAICTLMVFVPWTILPLRNYFQWALDYAGIMIPCYAVFMIFSGIFTVISYVYAKVQSNIMRICLVINGIYAVFGILVAAMMIIQKFFAAQ